MLRNIRRGTMRALRTLGVSRLIADSRWRQQRLLILCYHGVSQDDEHLWRPNLYMEADVLRQRLEILQHGKYNVVPLGEGLGQLRAGELPPRSVAITFDDGMCDFYSRAYPLLKTFGFPVDGLSNDILQSLSKAGFQPDLLVHALEAAGQSVGQERRIWTQITFGPGSRVQPGGNCAAVDAHGRGRPP